MSEDNKKEFEMRDAKVPFFDTKEELIAYIEGLASDPEHTYGSAVYAMSMAAVAAFQYIARKQGVTGFQASCADMDILARIRGIKGPWKIVCFEHALFPQYDYKFGTHELEPESAEWLKKEAWKNLHKREEAHPEVVKRWKDIADGIFPQGILVKVAA